MLTMSSYADKPFEVFIIFLEISIGILIVDLKSLLFLRDKNHEMSS